MNKELNRMQVRLFRKAWKKWGLSPADCADLFDKYEIDQYIADAYEFYHIQGDDANLDDIEDYLSRNGVCV